MTLFTEQKDRRGGHYVTKLRKKAHYDSFPAYESVIVGYLVFGPYFSEIGRRGTR